MISVLVTSKKNSTLDRIGICPWILPHHDTFPNSQRLHYVRMDVEFFDFAGAALAGVDGDAEEGFGLSGFFPGCARAGDSADELCALGAFL